jgi:hypothetical protein
VALWRCGVVALWRCGGSASGGVLVVVGVPLVACSLWCCGGSASGGVLVVVGVPLVACSLWRCGRSGSRAISGLDPRSIDFLPRCLVFGFGRTEKMKNGVAIISSFELDRIT